MLVLLAITISLSTIFLLPLNRTEYNRNVLEETQKQTQNAPVSDFSSRIGIERRVEELSASHGQSAQLVKKIIECESNFKVDAVNHDAVVGKDIGLFQINTYYHLDNAEKLGYNIFEPEDNLEYGFELLNTAGTTPWKWSKKCWSR